jgi:hypothetical protein
MQTRYFKTEQAARHYARNMANYHIERADAPHGLHPLIRLSFDEKQPLLPVVIAPKCEPVEWVAMRADNAELRRALGACIDALEKRTEYKANFLKLVVRHARRALGS